MDASWLTPGLAVPAAVVLGLLVGSFLNVVIHRLPIMLARQWRAAYLEERGESAPAEPTLNLVVPRSRCPSCGTLIGALQNIPVLSYLVLRGRCAHCRHPIGLRYPLIEALTALASGVVAWRYGATPNTVCALVLTWFLIALTFIDFDEQLLPDVLTLPLLWGGLLASLAGWARPDWALPTSPPDAILGAAAGYLSLWTVYQLFRLATGKVGMGHGDFKLLAALGAWLGWQLLLPILLLAAVVGALLGGLLIATRRHQASKPLPFGPFLAAAGWLAMLWGPQIVHEYLGLFRA